MKKIFFLNFMLFLGLINTSNIILSMDDKMPLDDQCESTSPIDNHKTEFEDQDEILGEEKIQHLQSIAKGIHEIEIDLSHVYDPKSELISLINLFKYQTSRDINPLSHYKELIPSLDNLNFFIEVPLRNGNFIMYDNLERDGESIYVTLEKDELKYYKDGEEKNSLSFDQTTITHIAILPNKNIAIASDDHKIRLWNPEPTNGDDYSIIVIAELPCNISDVIPLQDGSIVISYGTEILRLTENDRQLFSRHNFTIKKLFASENSNEFRSIDENGYVKIWDIESKECHETFIATSLLQPNQDLFGIAQEEEESIVFSDIYPMTMINHFVEETDESALTMLLLIQLEKLKQSHRQTILSHQWENFFEQLHEKYKKIYRPYIIPYGLLKRKNRDNDPAWMLEEQPRKK